MKIFYKLLVEGKPPDSMIKLHKQTHLQSAAKLIYCRKKINMLFTGLGSVRMAKNCDRVLENAALGLQPQAAFFDIGDSPVRILYHRVLSIMPN